ncbi:4-hydroxy-3-methylbut-2-en-1-yl diphosphate synthase (ferredoxin) [Gracilariopsis chorda]|uniref:4-hydroxy-3-methylbut-2-en-1-yl diphosphate synthase (Ferredoxin) n=1 Tax=Gracilariopsis chorda TaxID=448386 RepID=A0A2V3IID7_9FLOR|nr:4-hydroxy-3-methylbut-2-en-1-yl diphosphate synthase (ferredoxin) [Gracilariopsis chorda]|eukprot:PXF41832.1 4-hydroxy-3-methylbut-2-en-1-yl diphosphate synthase (ferredoxin) [Gracilariopsis chorda]
MGGAGDTWPHGHVRGGALLGAERVAHTESRTVATSQRKLLRSTYAAVLSASVGAVEQQPTSDKFANLSAIMQTTLFVPSASRLVSSFTAPSQPCTSRRANGTRYAMPRMHDGPARPPPPPSLVKDKSFMSDQSGIAGLDMESGAIQRRETRAVRVGDVLIGGNNPVVVQSMINEDTLDIDGAVKSIREMHEAGCEIVRVTCVSMAHAHAIGFIKHKLRDEYQDVPLVADVHHNGLKIALEVAKHVDKVRINPGLYVFEKPDVKRTEYSKEEFESAKNKLRETLKPLIISLRDQDKALRIGVNHGSLSERMLFTYGDTPRGMVESALECIRVCEELKFGNIVVSMKASKVLVMLAAYRMLAKRMEAEGMQYPLHLGVTEAGDGEYGRIKSTLGIGTLLAEGLGDTIRVSLTEAPVKEIPVCYSILQGLGLRRTMVEYVACPSCGRTLFNLESVLHEVREATKHMPGLSIAVMGCIVNGPGEMADADYGYVGKKPGHISLYRGRTEIRTVAEERGVEELVKLLQEDGVWVEAPVQATEKELAGERV